MRQAALHKASRSANWQGPMVGGLITALFLILGWLLASQWWRVKEITCFQDDQACWPETQAAIERSLLERPMLFSNLELIALATPELWGQIKSIEIHKTLPHHLKIELHSPEQLYVVSYNGQIWQMNELEQWRRLNQPPIEHQKLVVALNNEDLGQQLEQGERLPIFYHYALTQLRQYLLSWPAMAAEVQKIEIDQTEELVIKLENDQKLILDQTDLVASWQKWQYLWSALSDEERSSYQQFDLRFKNPVGTPRDLTPTD